MSPLKPLNGQKTHPLSSAGFATLRSLRHRLIPTQEVNPGLVNRLMRDNLVEIVEHPSPYATHRGKSISHLRITEAGRQRVP